MNVHKASGVIALNNDKEVPLVYHLGAKMFNLFFNELGLSFLDPSYFHLDHKAGGGSITFKACRK